MKKVLLFLFYIIPLLVAEVYLRLTGFVPRLATKAYYPSEVDPASFSRTVPSFNTIPRYPNSNENYYTAKTPRNKSVNSRGFVSFPISLINSTSTIYLIGDSLVEASEVPRDFQFHLSSLIANSSVSNIGLGGANAPTYIAYISALLSEENPSAIYVVWSFTDFNHFQPDSSNTGLWYFRPSTEFYDVDSILTWDPKVYSSPVIHYIRYSQRYSALLSYTLDILSTFFLRSSMPTLAVRKFPKSDDIDYPAITSNLQLYFLKLSSLLLQHNQSKSLVTHVIGFNGCSVYELSSKDCTQLTNLFAEISYRNGFDVIFVDPSLDSSVDNASRTRTGHPREYAYKQISDLIFSHFDQRNHQD